jgi:hypothetical protein
MTDPDMDIARGIVTGNPGTAGDVRIFPDGSTRARSVLRTAAVGFGTYQPGWRWSRHAAPQTGRRSENHVGYVISGRMMVRDAGGSEILMTPGCAFEVGPGHDAWVVGDDPCVALDFSPVRT